MLYVFVYSCSIVAVHDSARPLVTQTEVESVLIDGLKHGAAVLGVPMKGRYTPLHSISDQMIFLPIYFIYYHTQ
jgi:2-C-methyl-D-erythritol 4-phosphate cytidylyltransferase